MNKQWIIYIILIVIAIVLIIVFSKDIYIWLSNQLFYLIFLLLAFGAGWALGKFGGRQKSPKE